MATIKSYEANILSLCNKTGCTWLTEEIISKHIINFQSDLLESNVSNGLIKKAYKKGIPVYTHPYIYNLETDSVKNILRLKYAPKILYNDNYLKKVLSKLEGSNNVKLHENQKNAILKSANSSFMVLTGGPGTGKTFTINFIKELHKQITRNSKIMFAAPSGKAARRITESIGEQSYTVHSLLNISPDKLTPTPIPNDVTLLVIDEISMLDLQIFSLLLSAIKTGIKIILVGDTDQLPSVGYGAVLRDLIASDVVDVAKLTAVQRQDSNSSLYQNIKKIQQGDYSLQASDDFKLAKVPYGYDSKDIFLWIYFEEVKKWGIDNVLGLTPFRKTGQICSNKMNYLIQKKVNTHTKSVTIGDFEYKIGDPVMQLTNITCFNNGDIGKIIDIAGNILCVEYPGNPNYAYYDNFSNEDITLAYAMSIHKSQGSEAPSVVTALLKEHEKMACRNILYTAITRAKKQVNLLYDKDTLIFAIENESSKKRITMLQELLQYADKQINK